MSKVQHQRLKADAALAQDQQALRRSRLQAQGARAKLRDAMCTAENGYPGTAADYSYVPGRCVARRATAKPPQQGDKPPAKAVTKAQTQREVKILKKALAQQFPKNYMEADAVDPDVLKLSTVLFANMINPAMRAKHPDPIERYNQMVEHMAKVGASKPGFDIHNGMYPRYTILNLVLEHLVAL